MVEYFGGTTALWVPDQLKSAITRSCRYEAGVNRTYEELAAHYEAVVVPARPGKPKDKAVVESAVLVAQRWILARLRDQTFFSLAALNAAIWARLRDLNDRPLQQLGVSRRTRYDQLDRPALRPLPTCRYVLAEWKPCRVSIDYHIQVDRHLYSVPYQLIHDLVEVRFTTTTVEIYAKGRRITSHLRLAIDDWLLAPLRDAERRDLVEVIEDRAERASTLIASQLPVPDWHAVIGDPNQADAICDRLLHDAHRIELTGPSLRRTKTAPKTSTQGQP